MGKRAKSQKDDRFQRAAAVFRQHGWMMRTVEALRAGIHPDTLYSMRDAGRLDKLARGLYRLAGAPPLRDPDLVTVALKVPRGVICLISALAFHDLTTQIPHEVHLALATGMTQPRLGHPPTRVFRFTGKSFTEGVEAHELDGVPVRVYSPEKTLADCFKFRNKIGLDTAIEALRFYRERRKADVASLMRHAATCRVEKVMRPYLEALL